MRTITLGAVLALAATSVAAEGLPGTVTWTAYDTGSSGYNQAVATAGGFIALAGVSAEFGVVMLIYLKAALERRQADLGAEEVDEAIREGALLRVRPKAMTVAVILAGLFPILIGTGAGSEVMSRIAAPMVGGMITAPLLSMFLLPAAYLLLRRPRPEKPANPQGEEECVPQPT